MWILTLSSLFSLVVCISAASSGPFLGHRVPAISAASVGVGLEKRQVTVGVPPSVPSQCTSSCNPVNSEVSLGCPVTACCTTTFETSYYDCLDCVGTALNVANFSSAQDNLNLLYLTCVDMGFILPRLELPGQSASNSSSNGGGSTGASSSSRGTSIVIGVGWGSIRPEMLIAAASLLGLVWLS